MPREKIAWEIGVDFNVHPMCGCIGWREGDTVYIWDEIHMESADTERWIEAAVIKIESWDKTFLPPHGTVYPDPAGRARHTSQQSGRTDWIIIKNKRFNVEGRHKAPAVRDRYNAVNTRLLSGDGRRRLLVHPRCKSVLNTLGGLTYDDEKGPLSHMGDGLGYWVEKTFPVVPTHSQIQGVRF